MPARKKPAGTQQGHRAGGRGAGSPLVLVPRPDADAVEIPDLPAGAGPILAATRDKWTAFWSSTVATGLNEVDFPIVERWILAYDEWRRALNAFRRKRIVAGSTGQPTLNPLGAWVQSREAQLEKAERELAMGLKSRATLGLTMGLAQKTMADLNRMAEEDSTRGVIEVESLDDAEATILGEETRNGTGD